MRLGLIRQILALVLPLLLPRLALADSPRALSLGYTAPDECPSAQEFEKRVLARSQAVGAREGRARELRVQIAVVGALRVGRLSLVDHDGRSTTKTLSSADCNGLVDALALVAALALDSDERTAPADQGTPPPPKPSPPASPAPVPLRQQPASSPPTNFPAPRFGAGLGALVAAGPAPTVLVGGTLDLDLAFLGSSVLAPAFGLAAAAAQSFDAVTSRGTASFTWLTVRANACLLRIPLGPVVRSRTCLLGELGLLRARGSNTIHPVTSSRGWLSLGGASGLEVPLGSRLAVHGVVGVEAPLRRDGYAFAENQFFATPPVIVTASLSLLSYFP